MFVLVDLGIQGLFKLGVLNAIMPEVEAFAHVDAVAHPGRKVFVADLACPEAIFGLYELLKVVEVEVL